MGVTSHGVTWVWWTRRWGARCMIAFCAGALALAGSPQLHEGTHYQHGARLVHSCGIILREAGKPTAGIVSRASLLVARATIVARPLASLTRLSRIWVPKLFLQACRCEHGPPLLAPGVLA